MFHLKKEKKFLRGILNQQYLVALPADWLIRFVWFPFFGLSIPGEKWNFHFLDFLYHNKKSMDNNRNSHLPNFESTFILILLWIYKFFSSGRVHLHGESIPSPIFNRSQGWRRGAHGAKFVPHTWTPGVTDSLTSLRYESSTLILYKELSSTIFQSCQSVRPW